MKFTLYPYLIFLIILLFGLVAIYPFTNDTNETDIVVLQTTEQYTAGEDIILKFQTKKPINTNLWLEASYGSTLLSPKRQGEDLIFKIPSFLAEKRGVIKYKLVFDKRELCSGKLTIKASDKIQTPVESYLGPNSIIAGGKDFAMYTVVPSDLYDNPVKDSTAVTIVHQFLDKTEAIDLHTNDFIVWKNIFSYNESGRILVSGTAKQIATKEFTLDAFPSQALNFELYVSKKHEYADGNQIIEFFTSQIKDTYGNVISDGRLVEFIISTNKSQLRTSGTTINGIGRGYMVHPDHESVWNVKAFIPEMAESNEVSVEFKSAVEDYDITFTEDNRKISVGPIQSFMNQIIPDGAMISLYITENDKQTEEFTKFSSKGFVDFYLSEDFFPEGTYTIEVIGMGISKKYDRIKLE